MDFSYFIGGLDSLPENITSTLIIYLLVMGFTRLFGLKSFSKMNSADFAKTICIGALIAATVSSEEPSLLTGTILIACFFGISYLVSFIRVRYERLGHTLDNRPVLLMCNGQVLRDNLTATNVSEGELKAKLREANVTRLADVHAVVLETTGNVSVIHGPTDLTTISYLLDDLKGGDIFKPASR